MPFSTYTPPTYSNCYSKREEKLLPKLEFFIISAFFFSQNSLISGDISVYQADIRRNLTLATFSYILG